MKQYVDLVKTVLSLGTRKENRTGVDTISMFNYNYEVDLADGFPLLTTKQISWKNIVVENLWFLSGATNIEFLHRHGVKFWDAWADEKGEVPSAYGNFWRHFPVHSPHSQPARWAPNGEVHHYGEPRIGDFNDQIRWVIDELKRNPMSRRMVVSAWAPGNAQTSKLPPCHAMWTLNVQNEESGVPSFDDDLLDQRGPNWASKRLCLHLTQRSCDVALGVPYNIAGYALLLELFSRFSGIKAGTFAHSLVDAHIYTDKPDGSMSEYDHTRGLFTQIQRVPRPLPRLIIDDSIRTLEDVEKLLHPEVSTDDLLKLFRLEGYNPYPAIPFKVAV